MSQRNSFSTLLLCATLAPLLIGGGPLRAAEPSALELLDVFEIEWASDPQVHPDGGLVAYVRNSMDIQKDRRRSKIWLVTADGASHLPMTDSALASNLDQSSPRWSRDGSRLYFVGRGTDDGAEIFVWHRDGAHVVQLSKLPSGPSPVVESPDGEWLAFSMFVPQKSKPLVNLPTAPRGAEWAPAPVVIDDTIYRSDGGGYLEDGYRQLFLLSTQGGTAHQITDAEAHHGGRVSFTPDSTQLVFSANRHENSHRNPANSEVYRLDLESFEVEPITSRFGPDGAPQLNAAGDLLYVGYDDTFQGYSVSRLYVRANGSSTSGVQLGELDRDIDAPRWSADGGSIYFQYDDFGNTKIARTRPGENEHTVLAKDVGGTSLGRPYSGGSFSVSEAGVIAYTLSTPDHPSDVAIVGADGAQKRLTDLNGDLFRFRSLGEAEELRTASSYDGREIQGWIVKPPGFDPSKKYPLLLEIHGGPFTNYGDRFSLEVQLYAAAGYVVLYANPRGSTSYGQEFGNLIHHNYPSQDYDDLISCVDAVIEKGYVDPEQLYVTGGSGGGVLTSWIIGKTDRFRAAVVAKPVINWYSFVLTADNATFFYKYWFPGFPWDHTEHYMKRSPLSLVGNVSTPTMLLTGEEDYRTPMSESEQYYQALRLREIPSVLVRIPGASHGIANRPSQLMAKVAYVLGWFEQHAGGEALSEATGGGE